MTWGRNKGGDMDAASNAAWEEGRAAWAAEDWLTSAQAYERLLAAHPDAEKSYQWWFDAALAYKFLRIWPKAYELGKEAAARSTQEQGDPAFWNLGIAATIQRDWDTARHAWTGYGIELPAGEGEIDGDFGHCFVRIGDGHGGQEVVWARRICPTRAVVLNVPWGKRQFGETVLHDGDPNGRRIVNGRSLPVFDELMLWQASDFSKWCITVTAETEDDLDALIDAFDDAGFAAEPSANKTVTGKWCSEDTMDQGEAPRHSGEVELYAAAPDEQTLWEILDAWVAARPEGRA